MTVQAMEQASSDVHWLAGQLARLDSLASRLKQYRDLSSLEIPGTPEAQEAARSTFRKQLGVLLEDVARRAGVRACFACHEGLVLDCRGEGQDFDALGAMAQSCLETAKRASNSLELGAMRQMVLVGEHQKLALFAVGEVAMGIVAPSAVGLGQLLSR